MIKSMKIKLHNLSKHKKAVLQQAFKNYHLMCSALLKKAVENEAEFKEACTFVTKSGAIKFQPRNGYGFFKKYKKLRDSFILPSNLKTSAINDVSRMMCAYFASPHELPSVPSLPRYKVADRNAEFNAAMDAFVGCTDLLDENILRDLTAREPEQQALRPILIGSINDPNNPGVTICKDKKGRYHVMLFVGNPQKTPGVPPASITKEHNWVSIKDNSPVLRTAQALLLAPVEMGIFHENAYFKNGVPKEGRLTYDAGKDEYFLHLAFEFSPDPITTTTYMGVDRGIINLAAFAVVNASDFKQVAAGHCDGTKLLALLKQEEIKRSELQQKGLKVKGSHRRNIADMAIHLATNEIVLKAVQHKSQVFLEDLSELTTQNMGKKQRQQRSSPRKRGALTAAAWTMSKAQYSKFMEVLSYKLVAAGLPAPKTVNAAYTSTTCPICGCLDKENRQSRSTFCCIDCGYTADADVNAGRMIALKGYWHWLPRKDKLKVKGVSESSSYKELWTGFTKSTIVK